MNRNPLPVTTFVYAPFTINVIADAYFYDGALGPLIELPQPVYEV